MKTPHTVLEQAFETCATPYARMRLSNVYAAALASFTSAKRHVKVRLVNDVYTVHPKLFIADPVSGRLAEVAR